MSKFLLQLSTLFDHHSNRAVDCPNGTCTGDYCICDLTV